MTAAWPADGLETVGACPVCGSPRRHALYEHLTDRLFGAPGAWTLWRCEGCPTAYLDPRPTPETIGLAYAEYFWHQPPEDREAVPDGGIEWARRALRNGYLERSLGYEVEPSSRALGAVASALPGAGPRCGAGCATSRTTPPPRGCSTSAAPAASSCSRCARSGGRCTGWTSTAPHSSRRARPG